MDAPLAAKMVEWFLEGYAKQAEKEKREKEERNDTILENKE